MHSFKATGIAAVLGAGLLLTAPAAHAATVPHASSAACNAAVATATKAEAAYNAAAADLKKQIANGGHPGTAEESNVANLLNAANLATSDAARICGVTPGPRPSGGVRTGAGSMSQGVDTTEIAAGLGLLGVVGAGAMVLRRRRIGDEV